MSAAAAISAVRRTACLRVPVVIRSTVAASATASSAAMCSRSHGSSPAALAASRASTIEAAKPL
jgi:hypothetical protein